MDKLIFPRALLIEIFNSIGASKDVEAGGVIALDGNVVSDFYFDADGLAGEDYYIPSIKPISEHVNRFLQAGKVFGGIIHSHSPPYTELDTKLSAMDIQAAQKTMSVNHMNHMYMGVLLGQDLFLYKVFRENSRVEKCVFEVK